MNIVSIKFFSFYAKNKLGMRFVVDEFKNWETFCENFSAIFLKQNLGIVLKRHFRLCQRFKKLSRYLFGVWTEKVKVDMF